MGKKMAATLKLLILSGLSWAEGQPLPPQQVKGIHHPEGKVFTLQWEPSPERRVGYNVYRRRHPRGPSNKINPYVLRIPVFADQTNGHAFYYTIKTVNAAGQESSESLMVDSTPAADVVVYAKVAPGPMEKAQASTPVITPNGDGSNDRVHLIVVNHTGANIVGKIFDRSGRHVATLPPPTATRNGGATLVWSGMDTRGQVVPSGTYIYKVIGEDKTLTGTVAVGR